MSEFNISGDKEVIKALSKIGIKKAKTVIRNSIHAQASQSVKAIRLRAPVAEQDILKYIKGGKQKITKKGTLKRAIKASRRKPRGDKFQSNVIVEHGNDVKNDAYYWHFVEYGTVHSKAKPFITPIKRSKEQTAEQDVKSEFLARVVDAVNKAIK